MLIPSDAKANCKLARPGTENTDETHDTRKYEEFLKRFGWDYVMEEFDRYGVVNTLVCNPYIDLTCPPGMFPVLELGYGT
jgi:hypothetical protein